MHLFDIDIKNVYKFTESAVLTPGREMTTFEIDGIKCGLAICYDMYFEEFAKLYRKAGVELMFYPAAFNTVIGPIQWDVLLRARANDNQFYVVATSPARNPDSSYEAWGYSMVIDPWAKVITQAKEHEETLHTVLGKIGLSVQNWLAICISCTIGIVFSELRKGPQFIIFSERAASFVKASTHN